MNGGIQQKSVSEWTWEGEPNDDSVFCYEIAKQDDLVGETGADRYIGGRMTVRLCK
ncbi:MAG: hypothetical protein HFE73_06770 [Firmicutes bacterium]|nr:hypothetical protein [Bacillota bacterium]